MYIQITERCNMTCAHCAFSCTKTGRDMSMKVFKAACKLAEHDGDVICIGGGEPTLHKNFWAFIGLAIASSDDMAPWMATNGSNTETSLKLARLARKGVIAVALSRDEYHAPIARRVVEAFTKPKGTRDRLDSTDLREIRTVTNIAGQGRALENGYSDDGACACDELFVDPSGGLWACGCKKVSLGTVFNPQKLEHFQAYQSEEGGHTYNPEVS